MKKPQIENFLNHVNKTNSCWNWKTQLHPSGYGIFSLRNDSGKFVTNRANRASWILHFGVIPRGLWVLHKCDNRKCVNPDHLFLGTAKDNYEDSRQKCRNSCGDRHGKSILTTQNVLDIKQMVASGKTQKSIAKIFGVCRSNVSAIIRGASWKHLSHVNAPIPCADSGAP